ncbi:uncharacterized protein EV420DRAFT_1075782 [Desarmillaria tabescens]|uniref:Uncharacterized protein n=1 Tax=Armillaria tabescens TaxID=1929756 RepID=A0AA39JH03_ARMTA|nr:uncharacterized protein EV420DRAFT_1075782 [Desarmillaria tabescens]KAK0442478.1 hypothetical protein EV420DRAFT_1075782 [Desarmillaria tabescens]
MFEAMNRSNGYEGQCPHFYIESTTLETSTGTTSVYPSAQGDFNASSRLMILTLSASISSCASAPRLNSVFSLISSVCCFINTSCSSIWRSVCASTGDGVSDLLPSGAGSEYSEHSFLGSGPVAVSSVSIELPAARFSIFVKFVYVFESFAVGVRGEKDAFERFLTILSR